MASVLRTLKRRKLASSLPDAPLPAAVGWPGAAIVPGTLIRPFVGFAPVLRPRLVVMDDDDGDMVREGTRLPSVPPGSLCTVVQVYQGNSADDGGLVGRGQALVLASAPQSLHPTFGWVALSLFEAIP